jgi:hypothetical protein
MPCLFAYAHAVVGQGHFAASWIPLQWFPSNPAGLVLSCLVRARGVYGGAIE